MGRIKEREKRKGVIIKMKVRNLRLFSTIFLIIIIFFFSSCIYGFALYSEFNIHPDFMEFLLYLFPIITLNFIPVYFFFKLLIRTGTFLTYIINIPIVFVLIFYLYYIDPLSDVPSNIGLFFLSLIISSLILVFSLTLILYLSNLKPKFEQIQIIKKKILELSTKITRIEMREASELSKIDKDTVKKVMKEMVQNKEVYGKFFSTSKSLVFNQIVNIEEIDNLMAKIDKM